MNDKRISLIAAMDRNRLIGNMNKMPWNIPEDLAWFRSKTLDKTVIMGKNTWFSLGRTLDRRTNIVLTHDTGLQIPGGIVCNSVDECLSHCNSPSDPSDIDYNMGNLTRDKDLQGNSVTCSHECFVIGGAQIFTQFLPFAARLFFTYIDAEFSGDTWFPVLDLSSWKIMSYETKTSVTGYDLTFVEYIKEY
jgi:dihydrofolate reductase